MRFFQRDSIKLNKTQTILHMFKTFIDDFIQRRTIKPTKTKQFSLIFNPIALRAAKTPLSFGCSECNRVKVCGNTFIFFFVIFMKDKTVDLLFPFQKDMTRLFQNVVFYLRKFFFYLG